MLNDDEDDVIKELQVKPPTATITLNPEGIEVVLSNWEGVGAAMIERMGYQLMVASQRLAATRLQALHSLKENIHV